MRHQPGADTPMTQSVINPKAKDAQPLTIDHRGDPALQRSVVVLQQQSEPFEFRRECAVMKGIDLFDEALASTAARGQHRHRTEQSRGSEHRRPERVAWLHGLDPASNVRRAQRRTV
jgi:guanyl-specific ribonuclease Sa